MENGDYNAAHTNHDGDVWTGGVDKGGLAVGPEHSPDRKGKGKAVDHGSAMDGVASDSQGQRALETEELSDELQHITTDIIPLNLILTRLAEYSHSALQDKIQELASMPMLQGLANGNSNYHSSGAEDTSPESLDKKANLLNFIQDLHTRWVKALVIIEWSKNADQVGKLIDIRTHLASQLDKFNMAFWELIKVKQEMQWAKVPSPDLKTALAVLSTGKVSWMPDVGYECYGFQQYRC
jgi:mediator of RNA polymerase II transcription subunit 14